MVNAARQGSGGVVTVQPQQLRKPPNPSGAPHPEVGNFFWQYYAQPECCPCDHNCCPKVLLCHPCMQGEMQAWARGEDACCTHTMVWALCLGLSACLLEDRKLIERKTHEFHKTKGDPRAGSDAFHHEGVCCVAALLGPTGQWITHAQNHEAIQAFRETQAAFL